MAVQELYGPWPLTADEAAFVACLVNNWLSPSAKDLAGAADIRTADLVKRYGTPLDAQAIAIYPATIVFSGGNGSRDPST
jgi:hypothetical protein